MGQVANQPIRTKQVGNLLHAKIGQWIAVATLAGACVGYPLFLWLDPLAMFSGAFSLRGPAYEAIGWWTAVGLPAVVLLSLLLPGVWCGRLCPLGGTQELLWSAVRIPFEARASRPPLGARPSRPPDAGGTPALPGTPLLSGRRLALRAIICAAVGIAWAAARARPAL